MIHLSLYFLLWNHLNNISIELGKESSHLPSTPITSIPSSINNKYSKGKSLKESIYMSPMTKVKISAPYSYQKNTVNPKMPSYIFMAMEAPKYKFQDLYPTQSHKELHSSPSIMQAVATVIKATSPMASTKHQMHKQSSDKHTNT